MLPSSPRSLRRATDRPSLLCLIGERIAISIDEKPKGDPRAIARLRNIARDPRVTLLVDRYDDAHWERLAWVRLHGRAEVFDSGGEWPEALLSLRETSPVRFDDARDTSPDPHPARPSCELALAAGIARRAT